MATLNIYRALFVFWVGLHSAECMRGDSVPKLPENIKKSFEILSPSLIRAKQLSEPVQENNLRTIKSRSTNSQNDDTIELLNEPGFHLCPPWAGAGWCPEYYLCGDGRNGCPHNFCCGENIEIISCPTADAHSGINYTPCGNNSITDDGAYHCCDVTEICGDGTACTDFCAEGDCCLFNVTDVDDSCGYVDGPISAECPEQLTDECCNAPWDMIDNVAIDIGVADFSLSNTECWNTQFEFDIEAYEINQHCTYGLGSFEYICHHESGATCSNVMSWGQFADVDLGDGRTQAGIYTVSTTDYNCIHENCNNPENEDGLEEYWYNYVVGSTDLEAAQIYNFSIEILCTEIPSFTGADNPDYFCQEEGCDCPEREPCEICEICEDCDVCEECEQSEDSECDDGEDSNGQYLQIPASTLSFDKKAILTVHIDRKFSEFDNNAADVAALLKEELLDELDHEDINVLAIFQGSIIAVFEILRSSDSVTGDDEVKDLVAHLHKRFNDDDWVSENFELLDKITDVSCVGQCGITQTSDDDMLIALIVVIVIFVVLLCGMYFCCVRKKESRARIEDDGVQMSGGGSY